MPVTHGVAGSSPVRTANTKQKAQRNLGFFCFKQFLKMPVTYGIVAVRRFASSPASVPYHRTANTKQEAQRNLGFFCFVKLLVSFIQLLLDKIGVFILLCK